MQLTFSRFTVFAPAQSKLDRSRRSVARLEDSIGTFPSIPRSVSFTNYTRISGVFFLLHLLLDGYLLIVSPHSQFLANQNVQALFLIVTFNASIGSKNRLKRTRNGRVNWSLTYGLKMREDKTFVLFLRNASTSRRHLYTIRKIFWTAF